MTTFSLVNWSYTHISFWRNIKASYKRAWDMKSQRLPRACRACSYFHSVLKWTLGSSEINCYKSTKISHLSSSWYNLNTHNWFNWLPTYMLILQCELPMIKPFAFHILYRYWWNSLVGFPFIFQVPTQFSVY